MANKVKGERKITIGDKTYTLLFNMNALAVLESVTGQTMPQIAKTLSDAEKVSITFIRALLFAGLQKYHKEDIQTEEDAGELLSEIEDLGEFFQEVGEAFSSAMGADKKKVGK